MINCIKKGSKGNLTKKFCPREYNEGNLLLKKILLILKDSRGKWNAKYEGSYAVKKAFSGGNLILTTMDGEEFPLPMNSHAVKKYYA